MSRTRPRAIAPDPTRGFQPYPPRPFNPILFIGGIWLVVCLLLGIPGLAWFLGWLDQNLKSLSILQVGLILTTAGLIVIAVLGVIVLSMLAVSRYHQHRLVIWRKKVAHLRQDHIRAWEGDMAEWFKAMQKPPAHRHALAGELGNATLEHLAAELFSKMGYETRVVGGSGDKGVDVQMRNPRGEVEIVQCKQWSKPVGSPEVLHFIGAMQKAGAVYGYIVAPAGFTRPAHDDVKGYNIILAGENALQCLMDIVERFGNSKGPAA